MTEQEAIKILHPDTTATAIAEIEYYAGFKGREAAIKAVEDACAMAIKALEKQEEYRSLEEQGLLLRLPIRVGDSFWELNENHLEPCIYSRVAHSLSHVVYCMQRLGKTTFLTKEEAEAALEKMRGGK